MDMKDQLQSNKDIVRDFLDLAFNKKMPEKAVARYMGPKYKQHNPMAADGPGPFIAFAKEFAREFPDLQFKMVRQIAEGDLVVQHSHVVRKKGDPGQAVVDIVRLKDGKLVEHWDVIQEVPVSSANDNTMF